MSSYNKQCVYALSMIILTIYCMEGAVFRSDDICTKNGEQCYGKKRGWCKQGNHEDDEYKNVFNLVPICDHYECFAFGDTKDSYRCAVEPQKNRKRGRASRHHRRYRENEDENEDRGDDDDDSEEEDDNAMFFIFYYLEYGALMLLLSVLCSCTLCTICCMMGVMLLDGSSFPKLVEFDKPSDNV